MTKCWKTIRHRILLSLQTANSCLRNSYLDWVHSMSTLKSTASLGQPSSKSKVWENLAFLSGIVLNCISAWGTYYCKSSIRKNLRLSCVFWGRYTPGSFTSLKPLEPFPRKKFKTNFSSWILIKISCRKEWGRSSNKKSYLLSAMRSLYNRIGRECTRM